MDESRFAKLFQKKQVQPGDENVMADNPRNWLADKVNPVLNEYVNPILPEAVQLGIPKMTVAEDIEFNNNLPENMAGAAMGSIGKVGLSATRPGANVFGTRPASVGKVQVIESAADKLAKAQQTANKAGAADFAKVAESNKARFNELFGNELAKRKELAKQELAQGRSMKEIQDDLGAFIDENMAKIRRGD